MSDFHLSVHAFDVLDRVCVTAYLYDMDSDPGDGRLALGVVSNFPGEGETDPAQWVREVALFLLESI